MVKRGDLILWDGGRCGNILSGVVLSTDRYPNDWKGPKAGTEYLTVLWQTGKITIMPASYEGLEVISESR